MAYSEEVLRRARARLEQSKAERERENEAHKQIAYSRYPRLAEIDRELRLTMAQLVANAFRRGEDSARVLSRIRERNRALQAEREWILDAGDFEEGYLDDAPVCTKCGGSGYEGSHMCTCLQELCRQEQRRELTSLLGTCRSSFDGFRPEYYSDVVNPQLGVSPRKLMQSNLSYCRRYAQTFDGNSGSLLFTGATGLGKTFLSGCIAKVVADRGFSVIYETAVKIFADFEAEKFGAAEGQADRTQKYFNCDLLIMDDLGTEMTTQFTLSALYTLINGRIMQRKPVIISTNLADQQLELRYKPQIASRILGTYRLVQFVGEDIRRQEKEKSL